MPLPSIEVGEKTNGKINTITQYGLFVTLQPGCKDALLHISQTSVPPGDQAALEAQYTTGEEIEVGPALRIVAPMCFPILRAYLRLLNQILPTPPSCGINTSAVTHDRERGTSGGEWLGIILP